MRVHYERAASLARAAIAVLLLLQCGHVHAAEQLGKYNVNISDSSVSGLSSGGYFAQQMHTAYSSVMRGAGIFAGGPYNCAEGDLTTALFSCMKTSSGGPDVAGSISTTKSRAQSQKIDDPANLARQKVYLFSGTVDTTVVPAVMDALAEYYEAFVPTENIMFNNATKAAHTQPTNNDTFNSCTLSISPYLSYCSYDGAGSALSHIYGDLVEPSSTKYTGDMIEFDQTEFQKGKGFANTGYVYVPTACSNMAECKLHVAFHGCQQSVSSVQGAYIEGAGYNQWADQNNFIVLYPQIKATFSNPSNGNGCWNWWGYNSNPNSYDTQDGYQMKAVFEMMQRISSGFSPIDSPSNLTATASGNDTINLSWKAVADAAGYLVDRDGTLLTPTAISDTSYSDTGLNSGTSYQYDVVAVSAEGATSAPAKVTGTTNGPPPPLQAPTDLQVVSQSSSDVKLSWKSVANAASYTVMRNGSSIADGVTGTTYDDSSVEPSTVYTYVVEAVDANGLSGPPSSSVTAVTEDSFVCETYYDSNYAHVSAGRAYQQGGFCFAEGSNDEMGLWSVGVFTLLAETAEGYYVVGDCPSSRSALQ